MTETRPTIVFDLDGTLVDTAGDLIASINHALADAGMRPVDPDWLRPYAGHGGRAMIERVFAAECRILKPETTDRLVKLFMGHYTDAIPGTSRPYAGVLAALDRFSGDGALMAVCTNMPQALADKLQTLLDSKTHQVEALHAEMENTRRANELIAEAAKRWQADCE